VALARYGIALEVVDDPCLMSYALDAGRAEHLPEQLAGRLLSHTCLTEKEVMGSGRNSVGMDRVAIARATEFAGEETDIGLRLWLVLKPRLAAESVTTVYETLERPLARVLAEMERAGVKVERRRLPRCQARSLRPSPGSRTRSERSPERISTSARRSSSARSCSTR